MRVTVSAATFLAWVSAVVAQTAGFDAVLTPTKDEVVTAGSTYTITWDYSSTYAGTVSIQILEGATPTTLQLGEVIASGIDNSLGQYSWTVDSALGDDATYGLKIIYGNNAEIFQYSNPFQIAKAATTSSSSSAVAAEATTAAPSVTPAAAVVDPEDDASSTVFSTEWVTITSCAASVTDCPARSTVTSSTVKPVVTTIKASSAAGTPSGPGPVASSPASVVSVESAVPSSASSVAAVAVPKTTLAPSYPVSNSTVPGSGFAAIGTVTLPTSTSTGTASSSSSTSSIIAASGAGRVAAGSVVLVAGLMAAILAM
ncbi:hypothetical protein VSDG_03604 [Cytospora chrysosperma]|uniref:Yeast cell wall synthesis Kre9/Knh1-like N-terminal domain-containing protein n=1 Tax=Cytospora chrysosperma TaxID=252740 RepID=A0A423W9W3_CYTCH|nr:hypothetical protein VSDG_03604 [Valsa sordida]